MRTMTRAAWAALLLVAVGCSGGGKHPTSPAASPDSPVDLSTTLLPGGDNLPGMVGTAVLGGYTISLDTATNTAHSEMWRRGSQTDDTYFLSVDNFVKPANLQINGVTSTASTINIGYTFSHPFKAPTNLAGPATAANRADLGIAGRLVFLVDVPTGLGASYTFFAGEAIANTALVTNADGYYQPKGLLTNTGGFTANTFPYKLLVDEGAGVEGNRVGVSNGGSGVGNYRTTDGTGWQADNIDNSGTNNAWTGYDVLHQGQSATNQISLDKATITGSGVTIQVAVIAKYQDPRGGTNSAQKRANRLPKSPTDTRAFLYRMPFGAVDCDAIRSNGESGGLIPNNGVSSTIVRFHVRDFDARAAETTEADLNDDPNGAVVPIGTSGVPIVSVDVLGITTSPATLAVVDDDTLYSGDPTADSGVARDELYYEGVVQNQVGLGGGQVASIKRGLVKVADIENAADRSAYEFALDPTLVPLASNKPDLVTWQAVSLDLGGGAANDPPTANVVLAAGTNPNVASGGTLDFEVTSEFDTEGNPVLYSIDLTNNGPFEVTGIDPAGTPPPNIALYSGTAPTNTSGVPVAYQARVTYYDAAHAGTPTTILLDYNVLTAGANSPPTATISLVNPNPPSGGTLTFQLDAESDPDADTVLYSIDYDYTGVFTADVSGINPAPPVSTINVSPAQTNPGATPLSRTARVRYTDSINPAINVDLAYTLGPAGACTSQTLTFDFEAGYDGWTPGSTNTDINGWGHMTRACSSSATVPVTASAGAITGQFITSGDDGDDATCSYLNDYGSSADFNLVSPLISLPNPAACTPGTLQVIFNGYLNARSGGVARLYVSYDYGQTWGAPVWSQTATGVEQVLTNTTVTLADPAAGTALKLRLQYNDTSTSTWTMPGSANGDGNSAGLTFDNVRVTMGATAPIVTGFVPPVLSCAARSITFDFTDAQGWVGGQNITPILPNTDGSGWSSFRWTNCDPSTDITGTYQAVLTASAGAIAGTSINSTNDGTGTACGSWLRDYTTNANNNIVSPRVYVPTNCAGGTATLLWNAYLNVDDAGDDPGLDGWDTTASVSAYVSIDNGQTWNLMWNKPATQAGQTWLNQSYDITSLGGNVNGLRVRYQFQSSTTTWQRAPEGNPFGFYVDNVRLQSTNTSSTYIPF
ncbi:MAG: hypothetical protein ABI743_01425 [bacterium]